MTDERIEKLARVFARANWPMDLMELHRWLATSALAAIDADPEAYGYTPSYQARKAYEDGWSRGFDCAFEQ